jgi:predicted DNA-binding transcriptional regulator AlpA
MEDQDHIDTEDFTAKRLHMSLSGLRKWRAQGKGPPYLRMGKLIRYRRSDVDRWLQEHQSDSAASAKPLGGRKDGSSVVPHERN